MGPRKNSKPAKKIDKRCSTCGVIPTPACDWQQGRCPHRPAMVDEIMLDNYKARFYNLIKWIFKGK